MKSKFQIILVLLLALSMLLGACTTTAEVTEAPVEVVAPTEAPTEAPTAVPPTAVPEPTPVPPDFAALFAEVVASIPPDKAYGTVKPAALAEELADKPPFLLDLGTAADIEKDGYIEGAVNIPIHDLLDNLDKLPGLDEPIVVYCASGHRGGIAMALLKSLGYTNVRSIAGGLNGWKKAELPVLTGQQPQAAEAISTPIVEDQALFEALQAFLKDMPENYYAVKPAALTEALAGSEPPVLVDTRSQAEWDKDGYIEGATLVPLPDFPASLDKLPADKAAPIAIYCGSGHRGAIALTFLKLLGYENVTNLAGGLGAWKAAEMPVAGYVDWQTAWTDFLSGLPEGYYTIKSDALNTALAENPPFLLDVREAAEIEKDGYIAGSVHIPVRDVLKNLDKLPAQDQPIVVTCASGHRGAMVMAALRFLGYTDVTNLAGGLGAWKKAELAVEMGTPPAPEAGTAPAVDPTMLRDLDAFLSGLPEGFYSVKPADLQTELTADEKPLLLDVRTADEFATGYIEGSTNLPINSFLADMTLLPADKATAIVALCQSGHRGALALMALRMLGYSEVRNLAGGTAAWAAAELPLVK